MEMVKIYETLIVALFLIMLNIVFIFRPHPIAGVVISILTFFLSVTYFVIDTDLPLNSPNPVFTIIVCLIAGTCLICQWYDYKKPT